VRQGEDVARQCTAKEFQWWIEFFKGEEFTKLGVGGYDMVIVAAILASTALKEME